MIRRNFLTLTSSLALSSIMPNSLKPAFSQTLRVRRNINQLDLNDPIIETYAEAVKMMHALPDSDERSWRGQAKIHLDHCHRQREHFLTWHRMYLLTFEDIVRDLTGNNDWAVPYWDWSNNRQVPSLFFGAGNQLDTTHWNDHDHLTDPLSDRVIGPNDTLSESTVTLQGVENQPQYQIFSDLLEGRPHGGIHIAVGGRMGDFLSPLDPIFFVHHCNVDRIWAKWNRNHLNPSITTWLDEPFDNMFPDVDGNLIVGKKAGDLLSTSDLGYIYDDQPAVIPSPLPTASENLISRFNISEFSAVNTNTMSLNQVSTFSIKANKDVLLPEEFFDKQAVFDGRSPKQVVARISEINVPKDANNYVIRVFLNCPYLTAETPPEDPHYVSELSIFGLRKVPGMEDMKHDTLVDLTRTLVDLNLRHTPAREELNVQLIAVPLSGRQPIGTEFNVGKIEVIDI